MPTTVAPKIRNLQAAREATNTFNPPTNVCQGYNLWVTQEGDNVKWLNPNDDTFAFLGAQYDVLRGVVQ